MTDKTTQHHKIMRAEQSPYMYDGPECDRQRPRWVGSAESDKDGDGEIGGTIEFDAATFPPGTRITVLVPMCPDCSMPRDIPMDANDDGRCDCGFDWAKWDEAEFS